ncbi:MAG TPA: hypothetical protein VK550_00935 [Polyangiaceae bacterium]|nr:hypothetical protein [Polyangiaceae bacterium]
MSRTGPPPIYTCGGCGKSTTEWVPGTRGWRWPTIPNDRGLYDNRVGQPACSDACEAKLLAQGAA